MNKPQTMLGQKTSLKEHNDDCLSAHIGPDLFTQEDGTWRMCAEKCSTNN